jgi:hypothetical protein
MEKQSRSAWIAAFTLLVVLMGASPELRAASDPGGLYRWGAVPAWVDQQQPPRGDATAQKSPPDRELVDWQTRVDQQTSTYVHVVERIGNASRLADLSQISVAIDPASERLTLHHLRVVRDGSVLDVSGRARYSLLRRESELESGLVDGVHTLHILLEDTRVGDRIDYAYTLSRQDPEEDRRFYGRFLLSWPMEVGSFRLRLIYPASRPLQIQDESRWEKPRASQSGRWRELVWSRANVPAERFEANTPAWFRFRSSVEVSEFQDWEAVRDWAMPMYSAREAPGATLLEKIAELKKLPSDVSRVESALHFVQEEVRYTGLEMGPGAYRPASPNLVLSRRYGDCKDKTLLLVTLLRAVGIDAAPALVNSETRKGVIDELPRPGAFNHAISRVKLDGRVYWLDATRVAQGANLPWLAGADFEAALVLAKGERGLVGMSRTPGMLPEVEVEELFDLSAGLDKPASLKVTTIYRGAQGEGFRARMRDADRAELARSYFEYYRKQYKGAQQGAPIEYLDDPRLNEYSVVEHYIVRDAFEGGDDGGETMRFFGYLMEDYLPKAAITTDRQSPYALNAPIRVLQKSRVLLPEEWPVSIDPVQIRKHGLNYSSRASGAGKDVTFEYALAIYDDHVPAQDMADFESTVQQIRDDLTRQLFGPTGALPTKWSGVSIPVALTVVLSFFAGIYAVFRLLRWNGWSLATPGAGAPAGLRGWLVLVGLGVVFSPFVLMYGLWDQRVYLHAGAYMNVQTGIASAWQAVLVHPLLLAELAIITFAVPVSILCVWLYFRRLQTFPLVYIGALWLVLVADIAIAVVLAIKFGSNSQLATATIADSIRASLMALIWTVYMRRSQRVRATFTRTAVPVPDAATG